MLKENKEISIYNEELIEFEFNDFSIFYDKIKEIWFLESYEEELSIVLDDETFNSQKDILDKLNFDSIYLDNLKEFIKE